MSKLAFSYRILSFSISFVFLSLNWAYNLSWFIAMRDAAAAPNK